MNKTYKFVSGKGRVEMSEEEIKDFSSDFSIPSEEPQSLSELSSKVERILKVLESLKLISSLSNKEGGDGIIGNS